MENYFDFLVKKKLSGGDIAKMTLIALALAFIVLSVAAWLGIASALVVLVFGGYLAYLLISGVRREYEYVLVGDHMDVDEIIAGRRRRRLCGFDLGSVEICASVADSERNSALKRSFSKKYTAASASDAPNARFAVFSGEEGLCLLIFEPNDKILDAMKTYIRSRIY